MKALILAGGFGTRLGPLAEQIPKAMIVVDGDTVLNHLLKKLDNEGIDSIILTNQRFKDFFEGYGNLLIEETRSEAEKPGAVSAVNNAIKKLGIDEDLFVVCADNYFSSDFKEFLICYAGEPLLGVYCIGESPELRPQEMGTLKFEGSDDFPPPYKSFYIIEFREKSKQPLSRYVSTGAYIFPKSIFPILDQYCGEQRRDNLGNFIEHLLAQGVKVRGYIFGGEWYDISHKSYLRVFSDGRLVKSDERYVVCDLELGNLALSMTILHPGKETVGHSHPVSEVYFFVEGVGEIEVDGKRRTVKSKDVVPLQPGEFHRVYNTSDKDLVFLCVFEKYGRRG